MACARVSRQRRRFLTAPCERSMTRFGESGLKPLRRFESGHKLLLRSLGPTPLLPASPINTGEGAAIRREPGLDPSGSHAQERLRCPWRTRRTSRPFAIRSFSIRRTTSKRTRTFVRREWTLRSTTWFTEAGRPRSWAIFLDQGLSRPIPRCRRSRPQRPLALRNAGTPRKQNSGGLVRGLKRLQPAIRAGALAEDRVCRGEGQ